MSEDPRRRLGKQLIAGTLPHVAVDAGLEIFAEWLRERAAIEHDPDCTLGRRELQHYPGEKVCAHLDARCRRDFAIALADEIAPR